LSATPTYNDAVTSVFARILTIVVALVIGAVYGTAATVAHAYAIGWFPLGLLLAIVGSGALLLALRLLTGDRWTALAGGLGIIAATWNFSRVSAGGSAIVAPQSAATEWVPLTWTFAVPIIVALVVAWPDLSGLRPADEDPPSDPT
jgi:hypothetical protein